MITFIAQRNYRGCWRGFNGPQFQMKNIPSIKAVVYITLEYCQSDLFSGNGVVARSQIARFAASSIHVHVICGRPKVPDCFDEPRTNITISCVPLDVWFTTDRASSHEQFAQGAAKVIQSLNWRNYDACLAVDWTGMNALHSVSQHLRQASIPIMYLNFRCYMNMTNISHNDRSFYADVERNAVRLALQSHGAVISLCHSDDRTLRSLVSNTTTTEVSSEGNKLPFKVLLPTLRPEFYTIAKHDRGTILDPERKRVYLTSLVRLSEDKRPHQFVSMLRRIQEDDPDIWKRTGVVPLLLGAPSQPQYAERVRRDLKQSVPHAVVMDTFVPPDRLAEVLKQAVLNIHPAVYEAYGLTIVEAAAMGCASVINKEGIGAAQLVDPDRNASVAVDMDDEEAVARVVRELLNDSKRRGDLGRKAFERATSWTEEEYINKLIAYTSERVEEARKRKQQKNLEIYEAF